MWPGYTHWTVGGFWQELDPLCKATALVLAVMFLHSLFILTTRLFRFAISRFRSRPVLRLLATNEFSIGELLVVANANKDSHIAPVVLTGVETFQSAAPQFTNREAVSSADRAMSRFESRVHAQMRLGANALATIAAVAPFVGLLGTTVGIFFSFGGSSMQRATLMAMIADRIARALVFTAAALAVAVAATWSYNCLTRKVELLDAQIATAILQLTSYLNRQPRDVRELAVSRGDAVSEGLLTANRRAEIPYERGRFLLPYLWTLWLYFMYAIFRAMYWHFAG